MDVERIKQLLDEHQRIEAEIASLVSGVKRERAPQKCSVCSQEGHTARTCPSKVQ